MLCNKNSVSKGKYNNENIREGEGRKKRRCPLHRKKNSGKEEKKGDVLRTEVHRVQKDSCVTGQVEKQQVAGTQLPTLFEVHGCLLSVSMVIDIQADLMVLF